MSLKKLAICILRGYATRPAGRSVPVTPSNIYAGNDYMYFHLICKICASRQPLIGQMYPLHELKSMGVICEKAGDFLVNLVTERGLKLTFKPIGSTANCFVTALVRYVHIQLLHF